MSYIYLYFRPTLLIMSWETNWSRDHFILPWALGSRLAKIFLDIWQHDRGGSIWRCLSEGQLMHPTKRWNRRDGSSQSGIHCLRAASEGNSREHSVQARRTNVDSVPLFFWLIGQNPVTSFTSCRYAGFALNGGSVYIVSYICKNDWCHRGLLLSPPPQCDLRSVSIITVS